MNTSRQVPALAEAPDKTPAGTVAYYAAPRSHGQGANCPGDAQNFILDTTPVVRRAEGPLTSRRRAVRLCRSAARA